MSLLDFAGYAGLIIGICALLDVIVGDQRKAALTQYITAIGQNNAAGYVGAATLDSFLGPRLFGVKSLIFYSLFSLASLSITYLFAYFTTDISLVAIFFGNPSASDIAIFVTAIVFCVAADIICYAQTRIFLRAVDRYRNSAISFGLLAADLVIAITIFVTFFSCFRFVIYAFLMSSSNSPNIHSKTYYLLDPMKKVAEVTASSSAQSSASEFIQILLTASKSADMDLVAAAAKNYDISKVKNPNMIRDVPYKSNMVCLDPPKFEDLFASVDSTQQLIVDAVSHKYGDTREARLAANRLSKQWVSLSNIFPANGEIKNFQADNCTTIAVSIDRSIQRRSILNFAGVANTFLASTERNIRDTYAIIGFKLSPFVTFDPYNSQDEFIKSIKYQVNSTFLGASPPDADKVEMFNFITPKPEPRRYRLQIPFSAMLASSLTIIILFFVYIMYIAVAGLRNRMIAELSKLNSAANLNKAIFSSLGLVIVVIFSAITIASAIIGNAWTMLTR